MLFSVCIVRLYGLLFWLNMTGIGSIGFSNQKSHYHPHAMNIICNVTRYQRLCVMHVAYSQLGLVLKGSDGGAPTILYYERHGTVQLMHAFGS